MCVAGINPTPLGEGKSTTLVGTYLRECIYKLVLESQLSYQIVKYLFTITDLSIALTFCGGDNSLKLIDKYVVSDRYAPVPLPRLGNR